MNSYTLTLELTDEEPLRAWFGSEQNIEGSQSDKAIPGATLELAKLETGVGFLDSTSATVVLSIASSLATNIVASAIYEALAPYGRRLLVNGVATRIKSEAIEAELRKLSDEPAASAAPARPTL
jgi:hypothetical protein